MFIYLIWLKICGKISEFVIMDLENTNLDRINEILSIIKDDLLRKEYLQSKRIAKDWFKKKLQRPKND